MHSNDNAFTLSLTQFPKARQYCNIDMTSFLKCVGCRMQVFDVKFHVAQQICRSVPYYFVVSFRRLRPHSKKRTESMVFPATFSWVPFNWMFSWKIRWHISVDGAFVFLQRTPDNCGPVPELIVTLNYQRSCLSRVPKKPWKSPQQLSGTW